MKHVFAASLLLIAQPVFANNITGTVTGTVGDTEYEWSSIVLPGGNSADFSEYMENWISVSIQAHVGAKFATKDTINISFERLPNGDLNGAEVIFFYGTSMMENYQSDESVTITIEMMERDDNSLHVVGTATGEIYKFSGDFAVGVDTSDMLPVDLSFDVIANTLD